VTPPESNPRNLDRGPTQVISARARRRPTYATRVHPALFTVVDRYVRHDRTRVAGWFGVADAWLFAVLNDLQRVAGVSGDILEIGCYLGKSAVLLGHLTGDGEELVVIDPFEEQVEAGANRAQNNRWYPGLTRATFEANYLRHHSALPMIHQGTSAAYAAEAPASAFRFIHIDGSHVFRDVAADIDLAQHAGVDGAVLALDDVGNPGIPGVAAAAWAAVARGDLVPLAMTGKLYATLGRPSWADQLAAAIEQHPFLAASSDPVAGAELLIVEATSGAEGLGDALARRWAPPALLEFAARLRARGRP
jgi:SAM-dependent methyltransferase